MPTFSRSAAAAAAGAAALVVPVLLGAGSAAQTTTVQIAPRGPGSISLAPPGTDAEGGGQVSSCDESTNDSSCAIGWAPGTKVTLTPVPEAGASFAGWSDPDCPGTGACTVVVGDAPLTLVGTFSPLRLRVLLSDEDKGSVTSSPGSIDCPPDCGADFPAGSTVVLHATAAAGHTFRRWDFGCVASGDSCTATVSDQPTWVGASFDSDEAPQRPTTIKVAFVVRTSGSGGGTVRSAGIDCGNSCRATYDFGTLVTLVAQPDAGSTFAGWGGVCKPDAACVVPAGPVTAVRATFDRRTAPAAPAGLSAAAVTPTSIAIGWSPVAGAAGYGVYLDGTRVGSTAAPGYTFRDLACGTTHTLGVDAVAAAGDRSPVATLDAATAACATAQRVTLERVAVAGRGPTRRVLVRLSVVRAAAARLTLARGAVGVSRRFALRPGPNGLVLPLPRRAPAGRYRLTIAVGPRVLSRTVTVPR